MGELMIEEQLLKMARSERAKAQGNSGIYTVNGVVVKRLSRRFWQVGASQLKLEQATKDLM